MSALASLTIGDYFGIGGSLLSSFGIFGSTSANNAALKYQAAINRLNAENAEQMAQTTLRASEKEQQQILTKGSHTKAKQRVGYASSGIDLRSKTAQRVMTQTDIYTQADKLAARENAIRKAGMYRIQAASYTAQAGIAEHSQQSAWGNALSSLVGSVARFGLGSLTSTPVSELATTSVFNSSDLTSISGWSSAGGSWNLSGTSTTPIATSLNTGLGAMSTNWWEDSSMYGLYGITSSWF